MNNTIKNRTRVEKGFLFCCLKMFAGALHIHQTHFLHKHKTEFHHQRDKPPSNDHTKILILPSLFGKKKSSTETSVKRKETSLCQKSANKNITNWRESQYQRSQGSNPSVSAVSLEQCWAVTELRGDGLVCKMLDS